MRDLSDAIDNAAEREAIVYKFPPATYQMCISMFGEKRERSIIVEIIPEIKII